MSVDNFDPYFKWLGIAPKDQPPNHYRLLGIDPFIDDGDVISNAADRQMMLIRTFQTGQHAQLSQRLLNEIAAARTCLLDPHRRQQYDQQLKAKLSGSQGAQAAVVRERTVATRPPTPGGQPSSGSAPMSVPMAAPQTAPTPTPAGANTDLNFANPPSAAAPPFVGDPTLPTPSAAPNNSLAPTNSAAVDQYHGVKTPSKRRRGDSSQVVFWIVGFGLGAVLLLVVAILASSLLWKSGTENQVLADGGNDAAATSDGTTNDGDSVTQTSRDSSSTQTPPADVGDPLNWRVVGKRDWTWENNRNDIVAAKEMQPGSWLISRADYRNFELTLEYVLQREGAGGVYVRVPSGATWPWNQGLEVHFTDDFAGDDPDHESTGAVWHRTAPTKIASAPRGQWNQAKIIVRDRDLTVEINDEVVTRYRMDSGLPSRGHVGLDGVSGGITYRNVRIKELD